MAQERVLAYSLNKTHAICVGSVAFIPEFIPE